MKRLRILIFPGGTEIGLEIHKALSPCKDIEVFSAGSDSCDHAPFVFRRHAPIANVTENGWLRQLRHVIKAFKIDYIFPAHDEVIAALAKNQKNVGAKVVSSPAKTCLVARSKLETYRLFENVLPVPRYFEDLTKVRRFPVFVKPVRGQGSQDTHFVPKRAVLSQFLHFRKRYLAMEYLPGDEYTVDCFTDREKGLLFCSPRKRVRTRNGISMRSEIVVKSNRAFFHFAKMISSRLIFYGAWFFQLKADAKGELKLLEVAPRIAGTSAIQRVRGVNLPLLSLYEQERIPLEIMVNSVDVTIDRALENRYSHPLNYRCVYLDLDDTLILKKEVYAPLMKFIFQCLNHRIRLILLTKHRADIGRTLKKHRLSGLFDKVIQIDDPQDKFRLIQSRKAIFIDDSFSERKAVFLKKNIPTFDLSMLEMLMDDRV